MMLKERFFLNNHWNKTSNAVGNVKHTGDLKIQFEANSGSGINKVAEYKIPEFIRSQQLNSCLQMKIVWITINCGKFWKRWEYQAIWPAFWETGMQVRKQQLELNMEQQTGSK